MKITDFVTEDLIWTGLKPVDKKQACEMMVDNLIDRGKLNPDRRDILIDKLLEREALSSTGIGSGVAIPHASGENLENTVVAIGQAPEGVDFDAIDDEPVKLIFLLVGSERLPKTHLQLLAMIVRACKTKGLVDGLIEAGSPQEIHNRLVEFDKD